MEVGASAAICTPGLGPVDAITPPSTEPSGLGGCHTRASLASRVGLGLYGDHPRRRPDHPRGRSFTPASKRELTNSKHHMAPSPRPLGSDMGTASFLLCTLEWPECQSINARSLQFCSPPRSRERWPGARRLWKMGLAACLSPCEAVQQGLIGPRSSHPGPVSPRSRLPLCCLHCGVVQGTAQSLGTPAAQSQHPLPGARHKKTPQSSSYWGAWSRASRRQSPRRISWHLSSAIRFLLSSLSSIYFHLFLVLNLVPLFAVTATLPKWFTNISALPGSTSTGASPTSPRSSPSPSGRLL